MTALERAEKIVVELFGLSLKDVHLPLLAAQIEEAEKEARLKIDYSLIDKLIPNSILGAYEDGIEKGFNAAKEQAFEIASDNGTNCCECAEQIRAMKPEEEKQMVVAANQ